LPVSCNRHFILTCILRLSRSRRRGEGGGRHHVCGRGEGKDSGGEQDAEVNPAKAQVRAAEFGEQAVVVEPQDLDVEEGDGVGQV
jgi:hypothetical protein